MLTRGDVGLRDKTLWRMLYETAARISEVLSLDLDDLILAIHQARVRRKGGAADIIVWQTGTARLLPPAPRGTEDRPAVPDRAPGPARPAERRPRPRKWAGSSFLSPGRPGLRGSETLHQLRHSALTHAAEAGANTSTLLAFSGHTSVTSLARYARVSPEALARWQEARDPARRRR